jgi:hypothetical protein
MELKRCVRCGKFYATDVEVCNECERKDMADLSKLKLFYSEGYTSGITRGEISASTGISSKNLNRYLGYEEFSGIFIPEADVVSNLSGLNSNDDEITTKV